MGKVCWMRIRMPLALALVATLAACNASPAPEDPVAIEDAEPAGGTVDVKLTRIVTLTQPIALTTRAGDDGAMYVAEQAGRVVRVRNGEVTGTVLDIRDIVQCCGEEGLLGMAFAPNGNRLYLYHTDGSGNNDVVRYRMDGRRAVRGSRTVLLELRHPSYSNHNGGAIVLNPADGFLYIATGDGGGGGDPSENGQDRSSLLGKILRIDPTPSGGGRYSSPASNPFVGRSGRDEILHYGLRNPWRISIDQASRTLWIGDVGQGSWEEIDRVPLGTVGANFGWDRMEGLHTYEGTEPSNHRRPVHEYANGSNGRCAITGGHVIRDERLDGLRGRYLYSDYCDGVIRTLRSANGGWATSSLGLQISGLASFGLGPDGRSFVLSHGTGGVYRIDPR